MPRPQAEVAKRRDVFDAAQFRRLAQTSVSDREIKKLQDVYKDDIALALDKYLERDKEASEPQDVKTGSELDVQTNTESFDRFVLFVRRVYNEKMLYSHTIVVVKGEVIRRALRVIFRSAEGFSPPYNADAEVKDIHFFYWARPELCLLERHYKSIGDSNSLFEINAALSFIRQEWGHTHTKLEYLLPASIEFGLLWTIFPPDCLVVSRDKLGADNIWRARSHDTLRRKVDDSIYFNIVAECVDWDGKSLGVVETNLIIEEFDGAMAIEDLTAFPLKYHSRRDTLLERTMKRSEKKLGFCRKGFRFQECEGLGLCTSGDDLEQASFGLYGRAMVDPAMMVQVNGRKPTRNFLKQYHPAWGIKFDGRNKMVPDPKRARNSSRVWVSDLANGEGNYKARPHFLEL
ncbi:hypothetical protein HRG_006828 [Hirsutella rhossiliensis]|uniref:DUF7025 domain-containing protein n=1 Tax=Hirsutella rhossiliensis TaxID=111463 RepID=A0A9P8MTI7_9HYPO|nr:uncharacterized protein HRG_06828 [Hirsutella rhossiliensis]KAH0961748.1 hypothetical protein HRG_06828 [Hirsutella rhossiliensis]